MAKAHDFERVWLAKLARGLDEAAGEEVRRAVMRRSETLSSRSDCQAVIAWTRSAMERLVTGAQCRAILIGCACHYPREALQEIRAAYEAVFREVDFLLMPVTPTPAFRRGEKLDDPLAMYLCDLFTIPANLTGCPAVAFPVRETPAGLPIGAQLCGPAHGEEGLLGWVHRFSDGCPLPLPEKI